MEDLLVERHDDSGWRWSMAATLCDFASQYLGTRTM